jgi:hypothetical protein
MEMAFDKRADHLALMPGNHDSVVRVVNVLRGYRSAIDVLARRRNLNGSVSQDVMKEFMLTCEELEKKLDMKPHRGQG